MRTQNLTLQADMNRKVQTVRDFWRNEIKEERSRAGKILHKAILKK